MRMDTKVCETIRDATVLLSFLNKEPREPGDSSLEEYAARQPVGETSCRSLTLQREYEIAETLAFLLGTSDDPTKVAALCIQENTSSPYLTIRIATNSGVSDCLLDHFKGMVKALQEAASCTSQETRREILSSAILALDRGKLLSRLRSRHARASVRNKGKPTVAFQLSRATSFLGFAKTEELAKFRQNSQIFEALFKKLEGYATNDVHDSLADSILLQIIRLLDSFPSQNVLQETFDRIPNNSGLCPSDKTSTVLAIAKIRRYWASCEFLSTAVRRYRLFRSIKLARVESPSSFSYPTLHAEFRFERMLVQLYQRQVLSEIPERFCYQRLGCSLQDAQRIFLDKLKALHPKVHAEIQLVVFYENHPDIPSPRVISSTKSTCFLCNLFLKHHGRFYSGRTHGVLYPNWAMPCIDCTQLSTYQLARLQEIISRLTLDVEQALRSSIFIQRRRSHPNESVALFPRCWTEYASSCGQLTSSVTTCGRNEQKPRSVRPISNGNAEPTSNDSLILERKATSGNVEKCGLPDRLIIELSSDSSYRSSTDMTHSSSISLHSHYSDSSNSGSSVYLRYGVPVSLRYSATQDIMVLAPQLSLELSCAETTKDQNIVVCLLCPGTIPKDLKDSVVDLKVMGRGESKILKLGKLPERSSRCSQVSIYLRVGATLIRLSFDT